MDQGLKFSKTHEWVKVEGNIATIGLTDFAQHELGDIVYAEPASLRRSASKIRLTKSLNSSLLSFISSSSAILSSMKPLLILESACSRAVFMASSWPFSSSSFGTPRRRLY